MRALLISDIHGNLQALEAVLAAAESEGVGGFDAVWNLGDMVGYGARPNEVIERLRGFGQAGTLHVRGNHDRVCCGLTSSQGFNPVAAEAAAWTERTLRRENLEWLRAVQQGPVRAAEGVLCAHGSPVHEDHYIVAMRDAWMPLQRMDARLTFFGHTHVQGGFAQQAEQWQEIRPVYAGGAGVEEFEVKLAGGSRQLLNPGSVGQPRDRDWRAAFAVYDEGEQRVRFYRVGYDVAAAQAAIREAGLPERLATRLATGR